MPPDSATRSLEASSDDACVLPEVTTSDADTPTAEAPATARRRRGKGPDKSILGHIDAPAAAACGVAPGPIKLLVGLPGSRGFGEAHIESNTRRMNQIHGLGFGTALEFVRAVAASWTKILHGDQGRLILVYEVDGYDCRVIVERTGPTGHEFWSVTTAIPSRIARGNLLYEKP